MFLYLVICRSIHAIAIAVALVFTTVLHIFTCAGREMGACGKDEVLPQPDGSIVSGGTVGINFHGFLRHNFLSLFRLVASLLDSALTATPLGLVFQDKPVTG